MNFALGVNIATASELTEILQRAGRSGFSGIELNFTVPPAETEIAVIKESLAGSGIHLIAISAGKDFGLAAKLGAPVSVVEFKNFNGDEKILAAADIAAASHVTLAVQNLPPFTDARLLWALLEKLGHPAIGVCWNSGPHPNPPAPGFASASEYQGRDKMSDSPAIVIPMLNSKICHVRIPADKPDSSIALLRRLQGIGYRDWITLDARGDNVPEMAISTCLGQLRKSTDPALHKPKPHKAPAATVKK